MKRLSSITCRLFLLTTFTVGNHLTSAMQKLPVLLLFFLIVTAPQRVLSMGFAGVATGTGCFLTSMTIAGTFRASGAKYAAQGTCSRTGSLGSTITFSWTAEGAYSNGIAQEKLEVPPALISQPSHAYGKWQTKYSCPSDPWLTGVTCVVTQAADEVPNVKDQTLQNQFSGYRRERPITAFLSQANRNTLAAKRDSQLAAEALAAKRRTSKTLQSAVQPPMSYSLAFSPTVLAPINAQRFFSSSPIAIKLAPPQTNSSTQIDINTGKPVVTAWNVSLYYVYIERKDQNGRWVPHTTIPIGANEAHSAQGYTGFGAGKPPAFLSVPGTWRLNAEVKSPRQSGLSDWIEFTVWQTPVSTTVKKNAPYSLGK